MAKSRWASCPWYVSTRSLAFGAIWTTYRVFGGFAAVVFIKPTSKYFRFNAC